MNAYFTDSKREKRNIPHINITHGFIEFICSIVAFFTCEAVVRVIKIGVCAACFIGFFGVIGGLELGSINTVTGLLVCLALSMIEFFTLKSVVEKNGDEEKNN